MGGGVDAMSRLRRSDVSQWRKIQRYAAFEWQCIAGGPWHYGCGWWQCPTVQIQCHGFRVAVHFKFRRVEIRFQSHTNSMSWLSGGSAFLNFAEWRSGFRATPMPLTVPNPFPTELYSKVLPDSASVIRRCSIPRSCRCRASHLQGFRDVAIQGRRLRPRDLAPPG